MTLLTRYMRTLRAETTNKLSASSLFVHFDEIPVVFQ